MVNASAPLSAALHATFGGIDIYLFDQLLRGSFDGRRRVLDAGCGSGRNLRFLLGQGFSVYGIDADASAVRALRQLASAMRPDLPADNFRQGSIETLPWDDASFEAVVCSAVLHFAPDAASFGRMVLEMWRVLAPGGLLFARLASSIGIERLLPASTGRVHLPDGTERFVVDEAMLLGWTERLGGRLADPLKTTNVQNLRCMTTWVLEK